MERLVGNLIEELADAFFHLGFSKAVARRKATALITKVVQRTETANA